MKRQTFFFQIKGTPTKYTGKLKNHYNIREPIQSIACVDHNPLPSLPLRERAA